MPRPRRALRITSPHMSPVGRSVSGGPVALVVAAVVAVTGATSLAAAASTSTTTSTTTAAPPTSTSVPTVASTTTTAAPTSTTTSTSTTTTQPAPPPNLLAGVTWIQQVFDPSPRGYGTTVQMIGGGGVVNGIVRRARRRDRPRPDEGPSPRLPVVPSAERHGVGGGRAPGHGGRRCAHAGHADLARGRRPRRGGQPACVRGRAPRSRCSGGAVASSQLHRRRRRDRLGVRPADLGAFTTIARPPTVGDAIRLVEGSVQPADLCYAWNDVSLAPQDPPAPDASDPIPDPSAEIQTIRLALILLTGSWIDPTSEVSPQMAAVTRSFQASHGLAVDGVIGPQTTDALRSDLGCAGIGSFRTVVPPCSGHVCTPRRALCSPTPSATPAPATAPTRRSTPCWRPPDGTAPTRSFLAASATSPRRRGSRCVWSGTTPLQLVGLVDDPGIARRARLLGAVRPQCRPRRLTAVVVCRSSEHQPIFGHWCRSRARCSA